MIMADTFEFRLADRDDEPALRSLLAASSLPVDDVATDAQEYVLAFSGSALVGSVGLERCGEYALLRSFAVVPSLRRQGLGTLLFERVVARALLRGLKTAYVLTTTAERYCLAHGFDRIERDQVPAAVASTQQFRSLCPKTAACFCRRLDAAAMHLPKDVLTLRPDLIR
jgi:amino-acid N-acetyltransferase